MSFNFHISKRADHEPLLKQDLLFIERLKYAFPSTSYSSSNGNIIFSYFH